MLAGSLARLPLPLNHAVGTALGWLAWALPTGLRRITLRNLELCFPEQTAEWRNVVARGSLVETGKALTEAPWLWHADPACLNDLVDRAETEELLREALSENKGVIIAEPHLGSWEFIGIELASRYPMAALYRPPRQAFLEPIIKAGRERAGNRMIPATRQGMRELVSFLADTRGLLVVLPDQQPKAGAGVFAPFFGHPVCTMTLLPKLARKHRVPVLVFFTERLLRGKGYRYHALRVGEEIYADNEVLATKAMNRALEEMIRICPKQYVWSYKRFSNRPEGITFPYRHE